MTLRTLVLFSLTACAVMLAAAPVLAGAASPPPAGAEPGAPLLAASYWDGFLDHWSGVFQKQNGIVLAALLLGAVCLFIITRGKWKK